MQGCSLLRRGSEDLMSTQKLVIAFTAAVAVALVLSAVLTGQPEFLISSGLVALVIAAIVVTDKTLSKRVMHRHDDEPSEAVADEEEPIPSSHVITDDDTALGDTAEAHNEVSPRDFPPDHPGRKAAEVQAGGDQGTTRGDEELLGVGPTRHDNLEDIPGKSEQTDNGSPDLEQPSHPYYDEQTGGDESSRREQEAPR